MASFGNAFSLLEDEDVVLVRKNPAEEKKGAKDKKKKKVPATSKPVRNVKKAIKSVKSSAPASKSEQSDNKYRNNDRRGGRGGYDRNRGGRGRGRGRGGYDNRDGRGRGRGNRGARGGRGRGRGGYEARRGGRGGYEGRRGGGRGGGYEGRRGGGRGGGYEGRRGRRGGYDSSRRGREMDRRSQGRYPNNRGQQKKDGSGKFNYGREDENLQDTQQDWDDKVGEEENDGQLAMDNTKSGDADAQNESKPDNEGDDQNAEDAPPREKTEEELEAEKEAAYIGIDEFEKKRGRLDDDVQLSRREVENDEKQFACTKMVKKEDDSDIFDFGAMKKATKPPLTKKALKKLKKKKGAKAKNKVTRMHLDEFSPFRSTRNTRLIEGFGGRGRGRGRGGRGRGRGRGRGGYNNDRNYDRNDRYENQDSNVPDVNKTEADQTTVTADSNAPEDSSFPTLPTE